MNTWRLGVDSGGTFTDVFLSDHETGLVQVWKASSTPDDPSRAIANNVTDALREAGAQAGTVDFFSHGTTVATNALIEKRGSKTALLTTAGFTDLIEIGRQVRPHLYDLQVEKTEPLVPADLRFGVRERILHDGTVEIAIDTDEVRRIGAEIVAQGCDAIAICFINGFAYTAHEAAAKAVLQEVCPGLHVSASHEVSPEFREYERSSTVVANAYVQPVIERYLSLLDDRLRDIGITADPHLMQSNGGVLSFDTASALPARTILSGPAAGVTAAIDIGAKAGFDNLITLDMGGTSTDLALVANGVCALSEGTEIEGYPLRVPALDIHTVGAGGGSIASIDAGGLLKVGPRSAGGFPGPACYGNGTLMPTVTDANVVLQTLNPVALLDGRMPIDRDLSLAAVRRVADGLGLTVEETAHGIVSIAAANMVRSARIISVQRGHDPREFTLVAFGGAGPLHAVSVARELDIPKVLIPKYPGALCAQGLLIADLRADFSRSVLLGTGPEAEAPASAAIADLTASAQAWFDVEGIPAEARRLRFQADMRYAGQNFELRVPFMPHGGNQLPLTELVAGFIAAHDREYGFIDDKRAVELVNLRLEAIGEVGAGAETDPVAHFDTPAPAKPVGQREVCFDGLSWVSSDIYKRDHLTPGQRISGPAVIEQMDTTTVLPPEALAIVDAGQNIIIKVNAT
ncbi:MAG: hydantoinase/oxoprolinase family protein [Pseudomonadota bacterium]|nr:hydantoinase/oxoprolinase family protein [Pseudomonadota bacterium]